MSRTTRRSRAARACLTGLAGTALVAGVLAPLATPAAAQQAPAPTATPQASGSAQPSASAGATPTAAPVSARPELPAPALLGPLSPSDAPQPVLKDVVLSWRAVPGALGYRVQVSQDGDFSDEAVTLDTKATGTRLTLPTGLPHAAYRWRVAALQKAGHGFWSSSGAFTKGWREKVTGLRTSGVGELPTFAWDPVGSASEYELQISGSRDFPVDPDPTRFQNTFGTTACFTVRTRVTGHNSQAQAENSGAGDCDFTKFAPGKEYFWRVRALDHVVDELSDVDTTPVVESGVSYQPLAPKSDELDTSECPKPGGASATPSAAAPASAAPSATPKAESDLACEPANPVQKGAWSDVLPVVWQQAAPGVASAATLAPVEVAAVGAPLCTQRQRDAREGRLADCVDFPTLDWSHRDGAVGYRLYIALDDAFTNIQEIVETPATEWTPTTGWRDSTASQTYYYAVQACTETRCGLVGSTPDSIRKKAPRTELTSPAAGSLFGPVDVPFRWKPFSVTQRAALGGAAQVAEAYAYRLQVARAPQDGRPVTSADFQDLVEDVVVDGALCRPAAVPAGATVDPRATRRAVQACAPQDGAVAHDPAQDEVLHVSAAKAYPTGSYVWRVQALDGSGRGLAWSDVRTFTRDVTPPTVSVTGGTAVDSPVVARFSEPVRGLGAATVGLVPSAAHALTTSATSATLTPARTWVPGQAYTVSLRAGITDAAGNALVPVAVKKAMPKLVDDGSKALAYTAGWGFRSSSNAVGGGFRTSTPTLQKQTAVTVLVAGSGVRVTGCVGPAGGMVDVWVDGVKRGRVDTYRSYSGCGVTLSRVVLPAGEHRVQVRGVGLKRSASKGTSVMLDAITAL